MKELARDVDVLERLRLWLELRPGTQLALQARFVSGQLSACVAVSRSYELPEPHGTWAAAVDVTTTERPLARAIEQATNALERAEVQTPGATVKRELMRDALHSPEWQETVHLSHVVKLDLGSGNRPRPGCVGLDLGHYAVEEGREVWQFDLASGDAWPLADGQVSELYSSHLIEHLPACNVRAHEFVDRHGERSKVPGLQRFTREQDALFWFMDESYRVAKVGARFEVHWPALVDLRVDPPRWLATSFMDPTHRRFIPFETFEYFDREQREVLQVTGYAVSCDWVVVDRGQGSLGQGHVENIVVLEKRGP